MEVSPAAPNPPNPKAVVAPRIGGEISLLILNANEATLGTFQSMTLHEIKHMIDVNVY